MRRPGASTIGITEITSKCDAGVYRVSARVDGTPVWFESSDIPLRAAPEAFATAYLVPALHRGAQLTLDAPVCPTWHANVSELLRIFRKWWKTPMLPPIAPLLPPLARDRAKHSALCFSAGVDSFYTLLRSGEAIDLLVTLHGFDVPLADERRMAAITHSVRGVASRLGKKSAIVRTNLREHPLMQTVEWERTHGGALAAIAHVLDESIGRLLISSSVSYGLDRKWWGSHWTTDPLWSSSRVTVVNFGAERRRGEKLQTIAHEPLVQQHLRVCWENRAPEGNCCRCEKCMLAMMRLMELGLLDQYPVFEGGDQLAQRVDALPKLRVLRQSFRELARSQQLPPDVARALRELNRRTRHSQSFPVRARRYLARAIGSWSHAGGR